MHKYLTKLSNLIDSLGKDKGDLARFKQLIEKLEYGFTLPPSRTLFVESTERKWEIVSAFQKTVRRGNKKLALHVVSGMESLTEERAYMWKRICTVAAEDIGAANTQLMTFVLACASVFTPSTLDSDNTLRLWQFLTAELCDSPKSRVYCQYSILQTALASNTSHYVSFDRSAVGRQVRAVLQAPLVGVTERHKWLMKANWRAEGMAVGPIWHDALSHLKEYWTEQTFWNTPMLHGLPNYAYDKHTRVGSIALTRACDIYHVKEQLKRFPCRNRKESLAWALFYVEGGQLDRNANCPELCQLEEEVVAEMHGLSPNGWHETKRVMRHLLASGTMDQVRDAVLATMGYEASFHECTASSIDAGIAASEADAGSL